MRCKKSEMISYIGRKNTPIDRRLCKDCKEFKWCRGNGIHLRDLENKDVLRCHYKMLQE